MDTGRWLHALRRGLRRAAEWTAGLLAAARSKRREHRGERCFFALGRGFWGYLALLALAVVFTQALHSPLSAMLMSFVIVLPVVVLIYLFIVRGSLDAYVEHDGECAVKKTPTPFSVQVINDSRLPIALAEAELRLPDARGVRCTVKRIRIAVPPSSAHVVKKEVAFEYRGTYEVGVDCIYVYDPLRMFRLRRRLYNYRPIYVMPRRYAVPSQPGRASSDSSAELKKTALGTERSDVTDIRAYQPGDPMKNVHWKLSSKSEELQVRQYDMNCGRTVYIFCDLSAHFTASEADYDEDVNEYGADGVVELALAVAAKTLMGGSFCVPMWYDGRRRGRVQLCPCSDNGELDGAVRMLAAAPLCDAGCRVGRLGSLITNTQGISFVYVTDHLDGELLEDITLSSSLISGAGSSVEVYFFDPREKVSSDTKREELGVLYERCESILETRGVRVTESTAERFSGEPAPSGQ